MECAAKALFFLCQSKFHLPASLIDPGALRARVKQHFCKNKGCSITVLGRGEQQQRTGAVFFQIRGLSLILSHNFVLLFRREREFCL